MEQRRSLTIPASPQASARARRGVTETLGPAHPHLDAALLATSEVVSNAVQHGDLQIGDPILLEIEARGGRSRVAVSHPGPAVTSTRHTAPGPGGWGLTIVSALAGDWGIGHHRRRVRAWFDIRPST